MSDQAPPLALPEYLTVEEVAELLRVSSKTVRRWAQDDASMPVWQKDQVIRFHRERLLRWLRLGEQGEARPRRRQVAKQVLSGPTDAPRPRRIRPLAAVAGGSDGLCATPCAVEGPEAPRKAP